MTASKMLRALVLMQVVLAVPQSSAFAQTTPPGGPGAKQQFALHFAPGDVRLYQLRVVAGQTPSGGRSQVGETDTAMHWTIVALQDDGSASIDSQVEEATYSIDGTPVDSQAPTGTNGTFVLHSDGSLTQDTNEQAPASAARLDEDVFPTFFLAYPDHALSIGESYDIDVALPLFIPSGVLRHSRSRVTLRSITNQDNQVVARFAQEIQVTNQPLDVDGQTVMMSVTGTANYVVDAGNGWPIGVEGNISIVLRDPNTTVNITSERNLKLLDETLQDAE